jgi:hypothetical protein
VKKCLVLGVFTVIIAFSACNIHKSPNPVTVIPAVATDTPMPNPCCTPGAAAFDPFSFAPCIIDPVAAGVVVNSQAEYTQILIDNGVYVDPNQTPTPVLIDFTHKTLVGYIIGFSAPPFHTEITGITTDGTSVNVNVLHTIGGGICGVYYATGCARAFAVIDKTSLPVNFNLQNAYVPCVPMATPAP